MVEAEKSEGGEERVEGERGPEEKKEESRYQGSDPLTYVFWGIGMLLYAGFLLTKGRTQSKTSFWIIFYVVQPILFVIAGLYSINYGRKRNREIKVISYKNQKPR